MAGLWQVTLNQTMGSVVMANVLDYATSGDPTTSDIQALVDAIRAAYVANIQAILSNTWTLESADVRQVNITNQPTVAYSFTSGALSGSSAADPFPSNTSALISKAADTVKPNRGRMYVGGITENGAAGNVLVPTNVGLLQDFADDLLDIEAPAGFFWDLAIGRWSATGLLKDSWNEASTFVARSLLATQRRRLRK